MKFIVIEGLDGSGKSTQINLLLEYLGKGKIPFHYLHFPRTDSPVFGELIARFLRGDFGRLGEVHPYLVALIYAGDRNDAKELISKWMEEGFLVVADRYVNSNIAFQCAKLDNPSEADALKKWILELEYNYYRIPEPDINIFLDVPFEFTRRKLTGERKGDDRKYLNGGIDIHEQDLVFQKKVREIYLNIASEDPKFRIINCSSQDSGILPPREIFKKMLSILAM